MKIIILIIGGFLIFALSTLSGGGASLLLMPLIIFVVGAKSVAPIMTLGIAMSSSSRVFLFFKNIDWNLFKWLLPSTIVGSVLGARLFASLSSDWIQLIIGVFLVFTVVQFFQKPKDVKKRHIKTWHFVPIGFGISFLSGLIGGVGPLMNSAYMNYGMTKEELIGTRSANAVVLHISKLASYAYFGYMTGDVLKFGIILGITAIVGNYFGKKLLKMISELFFRKIVITTMVISGVLMIYKHKDFILNIIHSI
ncbi:sulfite exporter TauE/SafE family protein [Sinomicrobium weinanense]|uniref:Probable membrane transporter protein n=1 Tax=Sinomicrobium weinanense TaxID=2842200 RepID=A0A926JNV3_9FLAO|nr:sulfite exporter TauE/SafE family protein [Sinomicrobium weinanense]MBC9794656.1 sulfite exporter TauE/SafE family protein [Sinomicrobium weinanense]MBU3124141.1 sulfite exporter TauE/SafE family protein [Sinomicrobium weinanense]